MRLVRRHLPGPSCTGFLLASPQAHSRRPVTVTSIPPCARPDQTDSVCAAHLRTGLDTPAYRCMVAIEAWLSLSPHPDVDAVLGPMMANRKEGNGEIRQTIASGP
jgi:hypothetical protein